MEPQFRILGPLEVALGARPVALGGRKPRRLLAKLLLHAGETVSVDRLIEAVWEHDPPAGAEATLRSHIANLRRSLTASGLGALLITGSPGYRLQVAPELLDAVRFERLAVQGRAALDRADAPAAVHQLREALALWRGPVLEDLDAPRFAEAEAARLDELRLTALEARIDADLALGRHRELIAELEPLVDTHPFREHLWSRLMLALYRSGRQADALEALRTYRAHLDEELGLAPGQGLRDLETAILRHDPDLVGASGHDGSQPAPADHPPPGRGPAPPDALLDVVRRVPMVGRAAELDQLRRMWREVRAGARRIALISGEAGVGKTRLVAELAASTSDGAIVLVGRCEQAALIPYQPVTDALRGSPDAGDALDELPDAVRGRLEPLVDPHAGRPTVEILGTGDPELQRSALFDAVGQLVGRMASRAPVVLVVEEAEYIDQASSRLLRHLARNLPGQVLLLICFRDPPGNRHPPLLELLADLEGRGVADRLVLSPLAERDLEELVAVWTGEPAPTGFVHTLWSTTGGNPFYASEVVRELVDRGSLDHADDAGRVPRSVRDVLRDRLSTLSDPTQAIIGCAAVLGQEAALDLLVEVADRSVDDIVTGLEEALQAGWFVETGHPWETTYAFRHALMRQAVHSDLPAPERQRLHLRAADALEATGLRRPSDLAAAAGHLRAAGPFADRQRTASVSLRAAEASADLYAWDEAVGHAEAAVAILDRDGAPPERQGEAAVAAAELLRRSSLDYARSIDHLDAALGHYRVAGDEVAVATVRGHLGRLLSMHHSVMDIPTALEHFAAAESVLVDGEAAFGVRLGQALAALFGLRTEQGIAASQRAVELAEGMQRMDLVAMVRSTQASHWYHRGQLADAHVVLDEAWTTVQERRDPHLGWETVTAPALVNNVYLLDPATTEMWCRRALALPRLDTIGHAHRGVLDQLVYALAMMGRLDPVRDGVDQLPTDAVSRRLLLLQAGEWESVEASWERAASHDLEHGDLLNAALNAYWLGQVRWLLDRRDGALGSLRQALDINLGGPQVPGELMTRAELARYLAAEGDVDEASEHLARCDGILDAGEDWRGRGGHVELARGAVSAARGEHAIAEEAHGRAMAVFTSHHLPWWRCEALFWWAHWLDAAGQPERAGAKRRTAGQVYEELGARPRWRSRVAG
ncbi:MAG: hypothetical protein EA388_08345 [Nitriliruptor sp.]|nr:MAG: hypothetical protein EA388_08345 [Nitriliruptor sp.]